MRRESKRQPKLRGKPRTEVARAQQGDWNAAVPARDRFDHLAGPLRTEIGSQLRKQFREVITGLPQVTAKRTHGVTVSPGCAPQSQIDPARV